MAEDEGMERTERPTSKRLEEARKNGQVPRSPELTTAAVVLIAGAGLHFLGHGLGSSLFQMMRANLALARDQALDESQVISMFAASAQHAIVACAPIFGLTLLAALLAPMAIGGWNLSFGVLAPDFTRLSPLAGFGRMFSLRGAVELVKAFAKFLLIALIAVIFLWMKRTELLELGSESTAASIGHAITLSGHALLACAGGLVLIAAVDVPWQIFQYMKQLRMTRQEVRDELKESEGNPEVKGRFGSCSRKWRAAE